MGSEPTDEEIDEARKASARNAARLLVADPKRDRGQCGLSRLTGIGDEPFAMCGGRMVATYRETSSLILSYPVWVCSVCGEKIVP